MFLFRHSKLAFFWTIATIALVLLLIYNTLIYFQPGINPGFLDEKGDIADWPVWRGAFYFHITSSCIVLLTGVLLFFPTLLRYRRLHVVLGYIYFNAVLWVAAPTGLLMAPFSKGGFAGALGFMLTGVAWWYVTWKGYRAIRQHRIKAHIDWMVRSWCLSLSAVTFRLFHVGLFVAGVEMTTNYVLSIWLSLLVNVLFAELVIGQRQERSTTLTTRIEITGQKLFQA